MDLKNMVRDNRAFLRNLVLYGFIGGLAAGVDFGVFYLLNMHISEYIANIIAMHVGAIVSFTLNAKFNFQKTDKLIQRFLSYYLIVLCGMGLSSCIFWAFDFFIDSENIIKVISMIIVAGVQFFLNKFITFKF